MAALKLYQELADWWPLLSPPEEYAEEVAFFLQALGQDDSLPQRTMLELGSGGGGNAFHLKSHFTMMLTDISPDMLAVSRAINPECEHFVGDMRSVRLGRQFDVVFVHDAIDYMTTEAELRQVFETAFIHGKPGGAALFVPDYVCETFESAAHQGGRDGDGRALRFLEWQFDPDITDTTYTTHFAFMLREGDAVHVEHDQHECGLFARADWLRWLSEAGFQPERLVDSYDRDVFVAGKPQR